MPSDGKIRNQTLRWGGGGRGEADEHTVIILYSNNLSEVKLGNDDFLYFKNERTEM
jgi:hypothetical protein